MQTASKIVFASSNAGKTREVAEILAGLNVLIIPQSELGIEAQPETGHSFVENALQKARFAAAKSGLPAIADDSGLAVDALHGRPGIYSARYAGTAATDEQNIDKLLAELTSIPEAERGCGFHCAAAMVFPGETPPPQVAEAVWRGTILKERRGGTGFGYDPVFFDSSIGKTGAQMTSAEKNQLSHRGKAFRELRAMLLANNIDLSDSILPDDT